MRYLVPIEVDGDCDEDNPQLLQELVSAILTEGFGAYEQYGDLASFALIDIYISPPILVDDDLAEQRDKRTARLKGFWQHVRFTRAEQPQPASQLGLPGLGGAP